MSNLAEQLKQPQTTPDTVRAIGRAIVLKSCAEIHTLPVRWLWHKRIAAGMFGLFPGREGLGKSLVVYDLAAKITRGTLDGDDKGTPRDVLICATEDSFAHTVVPRLVAAKADLKKVWRVDATNNGHADELTLPVDLTALRDKIRDHGVSLVVLDPLLSRLAAKLDTHKDAEVRRALEPIVKMAEESGAAVLGIIHVNKGEKADALTSIMGSRAFSAVARYVIYLALDPNNDAIRLVGQAKNNVGPSDGLPLLPFEITPNTFRNTEGHQIETAKITWGEPDTTRSLRDVLNDNTRGHARATAAEWLEEYLTEHGGRAKSQDVKAAGELAHKRRTLERAAKEIGVKVDTDPENARITWWTLPEELF